MIKINLYQDHHKKSFKANIAGLVLCGFVFCVFLAKYFIHHTGESMPSLELTKPRQDYQMNEDFQKIKFIAYLQQGKRFCAALLMPGGEIKMVQIGVDIGMEGAKVVSILREKVLIVLPNNRFISLPYEM